MGDPAYGVAGLPGMGPEVSSESRTFLKNDTHFAEIGIRIEKNTQDSLSSHTPVTKLRAGLALVRVESGGNSGKYVHPDHADAPAAEDIVSAVLLMQYRNMLGFDATVEDKQGTGLIHGFVEDAKVLWGTADASKIDAIKAVLPQVMFI